MSFMPITWKEKPIYRRKFILWMGQAYPKIQRPDLMFSNVMYSINRNCGFSINDLILGKLSLKEYEHRYASYFTLIERKSPKGHASVQRWCARYFSRVHPCAGLDPGLRPRLPIGIPPV